MKRLLIVANTPSANTKALASATLNGCRHPDIDSVETQHIPPLEANADDVLQADGIILGTTENFGYMSGALKDFFDRIYYPVLEKKQGMPYALYVRAGLDGTGTIAAAERLITGLRWRAICDPLLLHGDYQTDFIAQCESLGTLMAASLDAGIA